MRIGLSYDLKEAVPLESVHPDDALEEYDSEETVDGIAAAIEARGHRVVKLGGGREFLHRILQEKVDLVFNIAEGLGNHSSREAQVPSVLEMLDINYTGSDPQCLAICQDKPLAKTLLRVAGILTPDWRVIRDTEQLRQASWASFPLPCFVKPAHEGSSKGIRLVSRAESPEDIVHLSALLLEEYEQPVMVEEFIAGAEVTVGVGGSPVRIIGAMRVLPRQGHDPNFVYSLEVKREWKKIVSYECPPRLPTIAMRQICRASLKAFEVLGCRDVARMDFRVDARGRPYLLEVNPLPGLRPGYSDLPMLAKGSGYTYNDLIALVLNSALRRQNLCLAGSA
ncbi:MAG: D-alanine--D-alanine ligase [Dehalococcoidia bacterium]|nr:D-alanine--D-alanine ligase [Dehalococcoidia bacterium]